MNEFFGNLASGLRSAVESDWSRISRPNQLPPPGDRWRIWLLLAGRGFGKTRTITEFVRSHVERGAARHIAVVGATAADCRDVLVEGPAGLLAISPNWNRPMYEPSKRRVTWPNGAQATLFSADEADRLRGPQHDLAICDELAAWRYPDALDMLLMGLRLGKSPRMAIATTPRPTKLIRDLLSREGKDVVVTRGSTLENRDNLAPAFLDQIVSRYEGTRLGRQEIHGELLEDTPGSLWTRDLLDLTRVATAPPMRRVVVAIDPAGSSQEGADETGIIVAGLGHNLEGYVLADRSGRYSPTEWASCAIRAYHAFQADRIIVERNYGGEMVAATITSTDERVPVSEVNSSRGKVLRAEPVSAQFERKKCHLVGALPELEDQMVAFTADWNRSRDGSPDRVDALVFALTDLMLSLDMRSLATWSALGRAP
jgi:phage terminase large subunit-like protein